jgi:hypothetical protein
MSQDVFDSAQLSAMTRAIDQIMEGDGAVLKRYEVAHVVFAIARDSGNFDPAELATMARQRLAGRSNTRSLKASPMRPFAHPD